MSSDCQDDDELCPWCKKPRHPEPCAGALDYSPPPHDFKPTPECRVVFNKFRELAIADGQASVEVLAARTAEALGTSVMHVAQSVALMTTASLCRGI